MTPIRYQTKWMSKQGPKNYKVSNGLAYSGSYTTDEQGCFLFLLACNASLWVIFCTIFGGMGYTKVRSPAQSWILTNKYTFKFEHILNWGPQIYLQRHIWPLRPFRGRGAIFYISIFGGMGYTKVRSPAQSSALRSVRNQEYTPTPRLFDHFPF